MAAPSRRDLLRLAPGACLAAARPARPNIVFIFTDDHHYQCLGAAGNPNIQTPHLDRLAGKGVYFGNGQITTSQCAPSRGVCLTGLETYQNGLMSNGQTSFRPDIGPTVIEQLRQSGYRTALVGKWHISPPPDQCGFAEAPLWLRGGSSPYRNPALRRGLGGADQPVEGHITDLFTGAALEYASSAAEPFFLWLSYNAPHTPWYADSRFRERYEGKDNLAPPVHPKGGRPFDWVSYYSVITHLDEAVGRLVDGMNKAGLWENTVFFFVGDNGFMCGSKNWNGKVVPWEESVRIPFFAFGGPVKAGVRTSDPVASIDLPATWLDLAGVKPAYKLSGESLGSYLSVGKGKRQYAFSTWNDGRPEGLATRQAVEPYRLVRTRTHKYILWESRNEALFDIVNDPTEENDLKQSPAHRRLREQLRGALRRRMESTGDPALAWLEQRTG